MKLLKIFLMFNVFALFLVSCGADEDDDFADSGNSADKVCESAFDCPIGYFCDLEKKICVNEHSDTGDSDTSDTGDHSDSGKDGDTDTNDPDKDDDPDKDNDPVNPDTPCEAGKLLRCDPDNMENIIRCNKEGTGEESVKCGEMSVCNNDKCLQQECTPNEPVCSSEDPSKVFKCSKKGLMTDEIAEDCGKGSCLNGACLSLCEQAAKDHSYQGCEFRTTIFMNGARSDPVFALTVSNSSTDEEVIVNISVSSESGEVDAGKNYFCIDNDSTENCTSQTSSQSLSVEPGKLGIIMFPNDRNIQGQGVKWNSLHITTNIPVTIYQFSPIDNSNKNPFTSNGLSSDYSSLLCSLGNVSSCGKSYSNDASLLIPTPSVYTDYIVSAHHSTFNSSPSTSYATIIGASDQDTVITVKPTVAITASNGIPEIAANTEGTITLKKGQVAQIEAKGDLSGSRIYCDAKKSDCHPFAVFSGVDCLTIPSPYGYCDHIEQQLFPVQTWGKKYILVKSQARGEEWDYVRIYASKDGTTLSFKPATPEKISIPSGWTSFTVNDVKTELNAGEYSEFYFKGTLTVEANNQIMVAQYLAGADMLSKTCQSNHTDSCVGDPAMMLIPPAEQFRKDYLFLTPGSYVSNYATIIMTKGESPVLDGSAVTNIHEIEGTNFSYAIVDLGSAFKNHTLTCEKNPCGLFVYGWEQDVSYAYPGGLNFEKLSIN